MSKNPRFPNIYSDLENSITNSIESGDSSVSLMLVNINKFNSINELFGRNFADKVLNLLYMRIAEHSGDFDFFHIFSDNFGVICSSEEKGKEIAEQILTDFESECIIDRTTFYLSISIGIATIKEDDYARDLDRILVMAEAALKNSKRNLYRRYCVFRDQDKGLFSGRDLHSELLRALKNDELIIYIQPKYTCEGIISGGEALIRWNHPEMGILSPFHFIEHAEKGWIISDITKSIIDKTSTFIDKLVEDGIRIPISFNMSPKVLNQDPTIVPYIQEHSSGMKNIDLLEMEILETGELDSKATLVALERLTELGMPIALDDFGTGNSSLTYLSTYPISTVKIDKSFVDKIYTPFGFTIIKTIIELSRNLGMKTVAEGVETEDQLKILTLLSVDLIQGYYFSKPLPVDVFLAEVKAQRDTIIEEFEHQKQEEDCRLKNEENK